MIQDIHCITMTCRTIRHHTHDRALVLSLEQCCNENYFLLLLILSLPTFIYYFYFILFSCRRQQRPALPEPGVVPPPLRFDMGDHRLGRESAPTPVVPAIRSVL